MTVFAEKLSTLVDTVRLGNGGPLHALAEALQESAGRPAVGIGSGGSAIMAEFFARCRSTLGHGQTIVQTPMDFVVSEEDLSGSDVWIFSAGADNPDAIAAMTAALRSAATGVKLLTVNATGSATITAASDSRSRIIVAPVADRKDGFLATHSLVAMVTCMLGAADKLSTRTGSTKTINDLADEFEHIAAAPIAIEISTGDTVVVLHDPQCRTIATLIETSLWETAIAPVQCTDFRNFAHGRHVWAARHPENMLVIAVTASTSRDIWATIRDAFPSTVRMVEIDLGHAGRFRTATSIANGLEIVRSLGSAVGIDPGKPGHGNFAGAIYDDTGLAKLACTLCPAVRHKMQAVQYHDDPTCPSIMATEARNNWLKRLSSVHIGGILLDYDGTVVTTESRLDPPAGEIISELIRLADSGIAIGFATGRGHSAGIALRKALPERLHHAVTVGYYNGGHVRMLDVDVENDRPEINPELLAFADWIEGQSLLAPGIHLKRGEVQITIRHSELTDPLMFAALVAEFPAVAKGRIKVLSSHHSVDILPSSSSKTTVTDEMHRRIGAEHEVLAIGDSGEPGGNDNELLGRPPSVSVDGVCGHLGGSWSLFGNVTSGPAALVQILRALRTENGHARFDLNSLGTSLS